MQYNRQTHAVYCSYTAKHLRGKRSWLEHKMTVHGKTFVVVASFNNEYLDLVKHI